MKRTSLLRTAALATVALLLVGAVSVAAQPGNADERSQRRAMAAQYARGDAAPDHEPGNATLSVFVTKTGDHGPVAAEDAKLIVYKLMRDGHKRFAAKAIARGETDENGLATFELPKGPYAIRAGDDDGRGHTKVRLDDDKRAHIHLKGAPGNGQPGPHAVGIAVYQRGEDGPVTVAGAALAIEMYAFERGDPKNGTWVPVKNGTTDDEGLYSTVLPKGIYKVTATGPDGEQNHKRFVVRHDKWVRLGLPSGDDAAPQDLPAPTTDAPATTDDADAFDDTDEATTDDAATDADDEVDDSA